MRFRRLFSIEVVHDFHGEERCLDVRVEPRSWHPSGLRALSRYQLLARELPAGIEVIATLRDDDSPIVPLADDLVLGFDLRVLNPAFALYTDLQPWAGVDKPTFRRSDDSTQLELVEGTLPRRTGVDAIEIDGISPDWLEAPPRFTIELASRALPWIYYLVTRRTGTPHISGPNTPTFDRQELTAEQASEDAGVKTTFARSDPASRCFRWTSTQPVACKRAPLRHLELRLGPDDDPANGDVLIRELPNPSLRSRLLDPIAGESLVHVIEY